LACLAIDMSGPTSPTLDLPSRAATNMSIISDDAIPEIDPSNTAGLLAERLQAWKHACGYLEDYFEAIEKIHGKHAKEYERALKVISNPLKEGHHFDQSVSGVAGFFENLRTNTQSLINTNLETEKSIKGSVRPILERLHKEIKHKAKELSSGAQKGAKEVEKSRNTTQKHIELLGQQAAAFDSAGGKINGHDDPYVVRRGVLHRLSVQVIAENNHHNDLLAVQSNFATFEAHVVEVFQQAMEAFTQMAGGQADKTRALHNDMLATIQRVPPEYEWANFTVRSAELLAQPNEPPRSVDNITFPNMDHASAKPLIEGSLERKSRNKLSWGFSTGYYVVTPSKFLHEFKDSDNTREDPKPELSIYLGDATVGTPSGDKFTVKGKDRSKTMSGRLTGNAELNFKAHTPSDAQKWYSVISGLASTAGAIDTSATAGSATPSPTTPSAKAAGAITGSSSSSKIELNQASDVASPTSGHESGVTEPPSTTTAEKKAEAGA
ncbi:to PH domain protein, partial [Geosmithia morbida]